MKPIPEETVEKTWQEDAGFSPDRANKEMGQEVRELAIYMFLVIYRMFQGAHEKFLDRIASVQTTRQPYVVKYVVDALMEENGGEENVALTDEQKGFLFLMLKTVIDVLDQSAIG